MAKSETTKSRLICDGCGKMTEYLTHEVGMPIDRLKATILKKAGWKEDCPACEKLKKARKAPPPPSL